MEKEGSIKMTIHGIWLYKAPAGTVERHTSGELEGSLPKDDWELIEMRSGTYDRDEAEEALAEHEDFFAGMVSQNIRNDELTIGPEDELVVLVPHPNDGGTCTLLPFTTPEVAIDERG